MTQATEFSVPLVGPASPSEMAQRIDDNLKAIRSAHSGTGRPSYAVAGTTWISTAEPGKLKWYDFDGITDRLFKTVDTATGEITYGDGTNDDGTAAAIAAALDDPVFLQKMKWRSRGIGELYIVDASKAGAEKPPSDMTDTIWIELTAGLTGVGAFNQGKLSGETVSGSGALVDAFAAVAVASSPLYNVNIRLLNTEGRIVRPSTAPGTVQNDAFQGHRMGVISPDTNYIVVSAGGGGGTGGGGGWTARSTTGDPVTDGVNSTPRTANETRMKNIGVKAYMRIK